MSRSPFKSTWASWQVERYKRWKAATGQGWAEWEQSVVPLLTSTDRQTPVQIPSGSERHQEKTKQGSITRDITAPRCDGDEGDKPCTLLAAPILTLLTAALEVKHYYCLILQIRTSPFRVTCLRHRAGKQQSRVGRQVCGAQGRLSGPPHRVPLLLKLFTTARIFLGTSCCFTESTAGKGYSEKPSFPSLLHGCWLLQLRQ